MILAGKLLVFQFERWDRYNLMSPKTKFMKKYEEEIKNNWYANCHNYRIYIYIYIYIYVYI
jgi:hypothetical protein